jgi:hypothetical protein
VRFATFRERSRRTSIEGVGWPRAPTGQEREREGESERDRQTERRVHRVFVVVWQGPGLPQWYITHNISYRTRVEIRSGCITRQCWSSRLSRPDVCEGIPMLCYVSPEGQAILPLILFIINPAYRYVQWWRLAHRGATVSVLGQILEAHDSSRVFRLLECPQNRRPPPCEDRG